MSQMSDNKKDARHELMLESLAAGMTYEEAAKKVGVSSRTLFRWCESDPELAERANDARCKADDEVESVTYRNCLDPDADHNTLRMFWLKSRRPEVYREIQQQEHKGGIAVTYVNDWRGREESDG
jgi:hypothetical protein